MSTNDNKDSNNDDDDNDPPFPPPIPKNLHPLPRETLRPTRQKTLEQNPFRTIQFLVKTFSTNSRQRHPSWALQIPSNNRSDSGTPKTRHVRLITIGPSHYAEKIRWALDLLEADPHSDVYYTEDAHPPALASLASVYASRDTASVTPMIVIDPSSSTSSSVTSKLPVSDSSQVLYESSKILPHLLPQLYPSQHNTKITALEQWFGSALGASARCLVYHYLFQSKNDSSVMIQIATCHTSIIERRIWTVMYKSGLVEERFRTVLGVNEESAARSLGIVRFVFQVVSDMLTLKGDGTASDNPKNEYLFDTGFSAADLTFASLASPLIAPPELAAFHVADDDMPSELIRLRRELRNTLAGRHVLEMYRKHRFSMDGCHSDGEGGDVHESGRIVVPKVVGRDRIPWTFVIGVAGLGLGAFVRTTGSSFHSKL